MHKMRLLFALMAIARIHAPPLKITAIRDAGNFTIGILPGQPDFEVIGLARTKAHIASAELHHPIGQFEPLQHFFGALRLALKFGFAAFCINNADQLDLGELVLAYHTASVASRRARF